MNDQTSEDLKLIDTAFYAIDRHKDIFKELSMQYEGVYDAKTRADYAKANRSAIFVPLSAD